MNAPKAKGDRAERALVAHLHDRGMTNVRRTKAGAEKDLGDLVGVRDRLGNEWCVSVKDRADDAPNRVERAVLEAEAMARRIGAPYHVVVWKRPRAEVGGWWCWLPVWALGALLGCDSSAMAADAGACDDLAQITVRSWLALVAPLPELAPAVS